MKLWGLHAQIISAQTVRNHLREADLCACRPHQGLDLTAVWHRNRLQWSSKVCSSQMNPSFNCTWQMADSMYVGKWFADVNIVNRVPHVGGGVMAWSRISYGQQT